MINFYTDGTEFRLPFKKRTAGWLSACAGEEGFRSVAVNFVFCSSERQLETNRAFLGHDWPTDVITFDYSREGSALKNGTIAGDIFVDPQEVEANAARFFVDPRVEMRRVMVHGVLHLCGYKDGTAGEQKKMRAREDYCLAKFYATV